MDFYFIFGPPAVGKMTVGKELTKLTGCPLFHNHMTIELVLPFFQWGDPKFGKLTGEFRRRIFEEVSVSDLPGLIFTFVWGLDRDEEKAYVDSIIDIFRKKGANIYLIELEANQRTRLERNRGEERLKEKPSKRNVKESEEIMLKHDEDYVFNSVGEFKYSEEYENYIKINNDNLSPLKVAQIVLDHFGKDMIDNTK